MRPRGSPFTSVAHFPLHPELAHVHNYPCNRYQALFFARPSVHSLRTRKIWPGDEATLIPSQLVLGPDEVILSEMFHV